MARFLFSMWPTPGHMYPSLPIAQALTAAGHSVAYVTLSDFGPVLDSCGIAAYPLHGDATGEAALARVQARRQEAKAAPAPAPAGKADAAKVLFRALFIETAPAMAQSVAHAVEDFEPDVLVHDQRSFAPALVAERYTLPLATLTFTCCPLPGRDLAPFGLGLPPARDAATRARYAALRARAEDAYADVQMEWNAIRATFGLPAQQGPLITAVFSRDLVLLLGVPELDYYRADLPPHAHYIGSCAWDPPSDLDAETAAWLDGLPADMPLALVTASTATVGRVVDRRSAALVEATLQGLATTDVAVLATLPFDHPLHDAPTPAHMHLARFVPHRQVLPRASVVVTHGGFGIALKALGLGLPLVVVPYAGDQPEVAQRIVQSGAGLRLDPATLTASAMRDAVVATLGQSSYRAAARRLAAALARHDGPAEAVALLTRLAMERGGSRPRPVSCAGVVP